MKTDKHKKSEPGHEADRPEQIPKRGWKQILLRVKDEIQKDHISIVAAGIAFFLFLALFPAIAALLSIYGLVMDPQQVQEQMGQLTGILPEQGRQFLSETLQSVAGQSDQALGWGVALSIVLSLWSANAGTKALFEGVNIAYDEENTRSFIKENALSLLFTLAAIVLFIICLSVIVAFPALMGKLGLPDIVITVIEWVRWLVLGLIVIFAIAAIYKFAPVRDNPKFLWVSWGAVTATILWLIASVLFSFYVKNFGDFDETYGAVAAVIIMMLWFYMTSFLILIGAEINAEMEHQTRKDTTIGEPKPMGDRDAYHADRVAGDKREK
jgi:membrane protein